MASTTSGLSQLMSTYYDKRFLDRAKEMMVYDVGAQVRDLPRGEGKTVNFNRFTPLAKQTTALTEATNPSALDMTSTIVSATVAEYGAYTTVGSLFSLTSIDQGLSEHVDVHGQNAGETLDELVKNELDGGGTVQRAAGKALSAIATSDTLTGEEIRKAVRTLKVNKARLFPNNHFRAIVPVSAAHDLRGNSEWLDANRYVNPENIKNGEIGRLHGVEFHETNNEVVNGSAGSGSADVYSTFVFGQNSYGIVDIASESKPRIYVKQPGPNDTSNPINLYSTIGWRATFVSKVLNSNWLIELKTAGADQTGS